MSENEIDDLLGGPVGCAKVDAGDSDEAEHDRCGLGDLATVGPLNTLELGPGGAQEGDGTMVNRLGGSANDSTALTRSPIAESLLDRGALAADATSPRRDQPIWGHFTGAFAILPGVNLPLERGSAGAPDEGGVELIDLSRMGERAGKVGSYRPVLGGGRRAFA
jgi:hypothetical protein